MNEILISIYKTLDVIEIKGKDNIDKMFCVLTALEQLIKTIEQVEQENNNQGVDD